MIRKNQTILLHVTGCLTFLVLPLLFSPFPFTVQNLLFNPFEQRDIGAHVLMIAFFYFNYFYLLPRLVEKSRWISYIIILAIALALITIIPNLIFSDDPSATAMPFDRHPGGKHGHRHTMDAFHHIGHNLWLFLVIVFFSLTLYTFIRLRNLQRTRLDAELSLLKSQIHPHFLFNTLNSMYGSALEEKAGQTASAIMRLSGILRYVFGENKDEFIPLERELSFLRDYIDLQKARLGETVSVTYEVNGDPSGLKIVPMLLITFVENAFRHGASPEEQSEIRFVLDISGGVIEFSAMNRKMAIWKNNNAIGSFSIEKVRQRLENYYPQKHLLHISDQEGFFRVLLNIRLI